MKAQATSKQRYFDLIFILSKKEIKTRYKNSALGYVWSLANPLAFATIYYFAFQVIMRIDVPNYALFLICGLFPWQWMTNSISICTSSFISNVNLIKKAVFPRLILPLAVVIQDGFHFLMTIPVILFFMFMYGADVPFHAIWGVPFLIMITAPLIYGIGLIAGSLNVFFRDVQHIVAIVVQAAFYMTPILYPMSKIPEEYQTLALLNPFTPIILCWKELLLNNSFNVTYLSIACFYSVLFLTLGAIIYRRMSWKFAEAL